MGVRPLAWHQRRWDDGRTLLRADLGDAVVDAFGFPHYQTHRADLLGALVGALPPERLHVGHLFRSLVDHGDRVEATFANGTTIEVDLLVGADGIHSAVREMLFGPQDPVFTGCAAYRGLVPADRLAHLDLEVTAQIWMGPEAHFVHYYVARKRLRQLRGDRRAGQLDARVVDRPGRRADAIAAFEGWHPQLREILGAVDDTFIWALFDRPPLAALVGTGRVTLLGDACHAMLPFMAQGAAQALEDGATLTACLTTRARRPRGPAALRVAAAAARVARPGAVDGEQDALPPARRARAARP